MCRPHKSDNAGIIPQLTGNISIWSAGIISIRRRTANGRKEAASRRDAACYHHALVRPPARGIHNRHADVSASRVPMESATSSPASAAVAMTCAVILFRS